MCPEDRPVSFHILRAPPQNYASYSIHQSGRKAFTRYNSTAPDPLHFPASTRGIRVFVSYLSRNTLNCDDLRQYACVHRAMNGWNQHKQTVLVYEKNY